MSDSLARLVGSPLGGVAFALWGLPGVVIADAASYVITAVLVAVSRPASRRSRRRGRNPRRPPSGASCATGSKGWRSSPASATLRTLAVIAGLGGVAQGLFLVLFLVYVTQNLAAGDTGAGIIRGVQAIGGVLGGLVTGVLARRLGPRSLIGGGYIVFGLLSLLTWNLAPFTTALWVYAGLFIAMGLPGVTTATGEITLVQTVRCRRAPSAG